MECLVNNSWGFRTYMYGAILQGKLVRGYTVNTLYVQYFMPVPINLVGFTFSAKQMVYG